MVTNKHVTSQSVKRFKKVHVQHKAYVAKPVEKVEVVIEEPVVEKKVAETPAIEEEQNEVLAAPKPRVRRKKAEDIENNEEKPEYDG